MLAIDKDYEFLIKDWNEEGNKIWMLWVFLANRIKDKEALKEMQEHFEEGNIVDYMDIAIKQYEKEMTC